MVRDITFMITHSFNINDLILETRSPSKCSILWLWSYISAPSPCPARPNIHILLLKQIILLQYVWNPNKVSNFLNSLSALDSNQCLYKIPNIEKNWIWDETRHERCELWILGITLMQTKWTEAWGYWSGVVLYNSQYILNILNWNTYI